jgi:DNA primase
MAAQPASRAIRYDNLRSAMAEEGVLRLLLRDESIFPSLSPLSETDFSSPLLGKIYTQLWQRRQNGSSGSIAFLSGELTADEMSHLTTLLQKPESTAGAQQALTDYIRIIREERDKRLGAAGKDPLAAAMDKFKEKKGYGGKRND